MMSYNIVYIYSILIIIIEIMKNPYTIDIHPAKLPPLGLASTQMYANLGAALGLGAEGAMPLLRGGRAPKARAAPFFEPHKMQRFGVH